MKIDVLDNGFVRLVECWGHGDTGAGMIVPPFVDYEVGIIEAARQSTQGSFRGWARDERLLRYLYEHKHATPFEFSGMVIEVRAPLFIFREWHRHRTQSYNEMSARYAPLPEMWYTPTVERIVEGSKPTGNKQADGDKEVDTVTAELFRMDLEKRCRDFAKQYKFDLEERGIPKELARLGMPVNWFSQMRAATCLRNWLSFLTLRDHPAAQWEIQQYAKAVGKIMKLNFPQTYALYEKARNAN